MSQDWKEWGRVDPLYGVATIPGKSKTGPDAWTAEEFLELGGRDWTQFRSRWEEYGLSHESCLEIGCGAGRITSHLARDFEVTHAVDVSAEMIDAARRYIDAPRVAFHLTDGVHLPLDDGTVSAVFSTHVFQHLESLAQATECFRDVYRVTRPAGTLMIHLPIIAWPHSRFAPAHRLIETIGTRVTRGGVWAHRLAYRRGWRNRPASHLTSYDVDWLDQTLTRLGFRDIEIRVIFGDSAMARKHPFVFARKAMS